MVKVMSIRICIEDALIKKYKNTLVIHRENGFQTIGNSTIGCGVENVESIVFHGLTNREHPLPYTEGDVTPDEIAGEKYEYLKGMLEFNGIKEPVSAFLNPSKTLDFQEVSLNGVTSLSSAYQGTKLYLNILVFINHELNTKTLVKLYKSAVDAKFAALWDMGVVNHFSFDPLDLEDDASIVIASKGYSDNTDLKLELELINNVKISLRESIKKALSTCGFPKDVVGFMKDVGVEIDQLVDAGMELVVGVDDTSGIREKLRNQIYHSLEDLNVISFIIAGIRLEEDYEKHRILGVDVDDDPAYLYSDEVFGMSIANQIAGTKAIFNFKRYDEEKPGIISQLGPVLDDVFAGLVAGCMSKIFEV